jgi:hypothetical protein
VLITINTATGAGTVVGGTGLGTSQVSDISFRSDGVLFAYIEPSYDGIGTVNIATGVVTLVGQSGGSSGSGMGFSANNTLYFANSDSRLYTLNQTTGARTLAVAMTGLSSRINAIDIHPFALGNPARSDVMYAIDNGGFGGSGNPDNLVTVNRSTGVVTTIGATTNNMDALAWGLLTDDERLPVELSAFNLSSRDGSVFLSWRTASETESAGFEVQRSGVDSNFQTISSYLNNPGLVGLGTTSYGKSYSYIDREDGGLKAGETYIYRLVDVSTDGVRTEHPAVAVRVEAEEDIDLSAVRLYPVAPNPVSDFAQLSFSLSEPGKVRVELYSADSRRLGMLVDGEYGAGDHAATVSLAGIPAGNYTLVMTTGRQVRTRTLVVVR